MVGDFAARMLRKSRKTRDRLLQMTRKHSKRRKQPQSWVKPHAEVLQLSRAARMERCASQPRLSYSLLRPALPFYEIFPTTLQNRSATHSGYQTAARRPGATRACVLDEKEEAGGEKYPSDPPLNDGLGGEDAFADSRQLHDSPCTIRAALVVVLFFLGFPPSSSSWVV